VNGVDLSYEVHGPAGPAFWEGFDHARLEDMPAELREEYLRVAPHPADLTAMLSFLDAPA